MPDKKLKDNEIIKALEDWIKYYDGDGSYAHFKTLENALDLINRLQAQNKDLAETVHNLTLEKDALFDKAERLASIIDDLDCQISTADDCIAEKQAEIIRLQSMNQAKLDTIHDLQVEIEQWKEEANKYQNLWCMAVDDIEKAKSEAYKEFARRLKCGVPQETGVIRCSDIDNLVKEMVGDDNA